ncbi:hypothetical protein [Mangrovicoccus ximenensis]|uniref:hypothetical protein n=1 Tax=Mangrovicoccus ximenensis TaxID=1911570 RepID=UPI0038B330C9
MPGEAGNGTLFGGNGRDVERGRCEARRAGPGAGHGRFIDNADAARRAAARATASSRQRRQRPADRWRRGRPFSRTSRTA